MKARSFIQQGCRQLRQEALAQSLSQHRPEGLRGTPKNRGTWTAPAPGPGPTLRSRRRLLQMKNRMDRSFGGVASLWDWSAQAQAPGPSRCRVAQWSQAPQCGDDTRQSQRRGRGPRDDTRRSQASRGRQVPPEAGSVVPRSVQWQAPQPRRAQGRHPSVSGPQASRGRQVPPEPGSVVPRSAQWQAPRG